MKCEICGTKVPFPMRNQCDPCFELEQIVGRELQFRPAVFYKVVNAALSKYDMVCVSKTVLNPNQGEISDAEV